VRDTLDNIVSLAHVFFTVVILLICVNFETFHFIVRHQWGLLFRGFVGVPR